MSQLKKKKKIFKGKLSSKLRFLLCSYKKEHFLGHFCVTDSQTHSQTDGRTDGRKGRVTELHVTAKNIIHKTRMMGVGEKEL